MKKLLLLCLVAVMGAGVCSAQKKGTKQDRMVTVVFDTDIDCEHCAKKIMNNVPSLGKGVEDVKVDVPTKEVTVTFDNTKNSVANLIKGFASIKVKAAPKSEAAAGVGKSGGDHDHDHDHDHAAGK